MRAKSTKNLLHISPERMAELQRKTLIESTNSSLRLPGSKVTNKQVAQIMKVKNDMACKVVAGTHAGKFGIVKDMNTSKTGAVTITVLQANGVRFKTLAKNIQAS